MTQNKKHCDKGSNIKIQTFSLHPSTNLRISFHTKIENPHDIANTVLSMKENLGDGSITGEKFILLNSKLIVSMDHIGIAANSALIRFENTMLRSVEDTGDQSTTEHRTTRQKKRRGVAIETVVCAGGSTNVGIVLREFAFDCGQSNASHVSGSQVESGVSASLFALGFDCKDDEEYVQFLGKVGLGPPEPIDDYIERNRTEKEMEDIRRTFKLTDEEIEMNGSSLKNAVLTRIASKYHV